MRYDIYDMDDGLWACWDDRHGYLSPWLKEKSYLQWYATEFGCTGRTLPSARTLYRSEADSKEAERERAATQGR